MQLVMQESEFTAIRAQGPGGQNVNKVSSAVQLRFDIARSSLPSDVKLRLLATADQRLTLAGVIVIKAQTARTQEQNKTEALRRLLEIIERAATPPKLRKATKPSYGSKLRRLEGKAVRANVKVGRSKIDI